MLKKDNILLGVAFAAALTLLGAGIVYLVVFLLDMNEINLYKTLILTFIAPTLAVRYYAKKKFFESLKGAVLALVSLFIAYFIIFVR
ncbi:MAG: hypothetical protein LBR17_07740 [Bacteroidales bacterium]|jgi:hypothetical protein|nr:hypothetical protein [Bacteroidales bacterium]